YLALPPACPPLFLYSVLLVLIQSINLIFHTYTLVVFLSRRARRLPLSLDRNQFAAGWPSVGWRQIEHVFL
ncbi:TPA: hypothetical protein ACIJYO_005041, partial [Serratia marcescens]